MSATFELICHHVYAGWDGLPVDLSHHDSHGQAIDTQFLKDGVAPNSGALRFWKSGSRVYVPASNSWRSLGGIKIEVTARRRITPILLDDHQTLIAGGAVLSSQRTRILEFALKSRLPVISTSPQMVEAGGLMSYGANIYDLDRRAATYVDKILKGGN